MSDALEHDADAGKYTLPNGLPALRDVDLDLFQRAAKDLDDLTQAQDDLRSRPVQTAPASFQAAMARAQGSPRCSARGPNTFTQNQSQVFQSAIWP